MVSLKRAAGNQKFFDPTIFQKCWRGSGRAALIAARRQRNPRAILLAHGVGGEKSDRFSRRSEQDRRLVRPYQQTSILQLFRGNSCNENALQKILLLEKTVFSVRQKGVLPLLLPASMLQLHFLKLANSQFACLCETSYKFGQGNGAIAACWQAKAGVEPPFAGR